MSVVDFALIFIPSPIPPSAEFSPPQQIAGKVIENKFATQTDRVHRVTWQPSPSKGVIAYNVYRGRELVANIPSDKRLVYEAHNQRKGNPIPIL